jgi:rRNA processing protein Gar1
VYLITSVLYGLMKDFIKDLVVVQQGVQMGELYKIIGSIRESHKVVRAQKDNFELLVRLV